MNKILAINGGEPVRKELLPSQNTIGMEEKRMVDKVLATGKLTGFQANWENNLGGEYVQELEKLWAEKFNAKYAIAVNSCTSGLIIACGAIGIQPNDEVIVTPFSMTCSATAPMAWGGVPVFADIEKDYYCLDPNSIKNRITTKTKAIIPVSLFGLPYDYQMIKLIAMENNLYIIEDAAQAVGAQNRNMYCGLLGDIGVFSLNQGKHMTCGEGGVIVTNNSMLAYRCRLLRNHAEAVNNSFKEKDGFNPEWVQLFGFNLRLTEIQAAMAIAQLKRFDTMLKNRLRNIAYLTEGLKEIPCLTMPAIRDNCTHSFYVLPLKYNNYEKNNSCRRFVKAVKAELQPVKDKENEGVPIGSGYTRPIYRMPLFNVQESISPVCERIYNNELIIIHSLIGPNADKKSLDDVIQAFWKVWEHRQEI